MDDGLSTHCLRPGSKHPMPNEAETRKAGAYPKANGSSFASYSSAHSAERTIAKYLADTENGAPRAWNDSHGVKSKVSDIHLDLDPDCGFHDDMGCSDYDLLSPGEVPTPHLVDSYFHAAQPNEDDIKGRPARCQSQSDKSQCRDAYIQSVAKKDNANSNQIPDFDLEERLRLADLDEHVKRYQHESNLLKKLQSQTEQAQKDIAREHEQLWREVEAERQAMHIEYDAEQAALKKERRRLGLNAEKQRVELAQARECAEEKRQSQQRVEQLEEELQEKEKRWQRTVDRLQRQVSEVTRRNQELEEELRRGRQQPHSAGMQPLPGTGGREVRRAASATSLRGRQAPDVSVRSQPMISPVLSRTAVGFTKRPEGDEQAVCADRYGRVLTNPTSGQAAGQGHSLQSNNTLLKPDAGDDEERSPVLSGSSRDVVSTKTADGRTERVFRDGRRELEFPNGLRKVTHPDGRTQVLFQNGDEKELHPDGKVVYQYGATGAVQTTLPDGRELYQFKDGQSETHRPDGSKEILFPNGTTKVVEADGTESVTFPDGTARRTASAAFMTESTTASSS